MRYIIIAVLCVAALVFSARAYETERVVIVVVDGPRDREFLEHPYHMYIPRIWNELRPAGYISHAFYNLWITKTVPGHTSIATGVHQDIDLSGNERPSRPALWEYFRHETGLPDRKAVLVTYKNKLLNLSYSTDSSYGVQDSAVVIGPLWSDTLCVSRFIDYAKENEPIISLLALGHVDGMAHRCSTFTWYTNAIRGADGLSADLWNWIQTTPGYADRTTLIITADHGRHDTDWCEHGDDCPGCRHLPFIALGPDIRAGVEDSAHPADQRDINATVCELLGIHAPYSDGRVMTEMLQAYASTDPAHGELRPASFELVTPAVDYARLRLIVPPDYPAHERFALTLFDVLGRPLWSADSSARELMAGRRLMRPAARPSSRLTWLRIRRLGDSSEGAISKPLLWIR